MSGGADLTVLDLFSAAAGGWSLGMHRAGFRTVAAAEKEAWRRALYAENNPGVILYDDVCGLTANRVRADVGALPKYVVGSPPCQGISSANNAKGRGVDDPRSGLFFEAIRIIGEIRPRGIALENSADLRTKGADRVLAALEDLGYACWPVVVRARDAGANHLRSRVWIIGFDLDQLAGGNHVDAAGVGREGGRSWGRRSYGDGASPVAPGHVADSTEVGSQGLAGRDSRGYGPREGEHAGVAAPGPGAYADSEGQPDGASDAEVGRSSSTRHAAQEPWSQWNGGLAHHLRVDDGLSAWVAGARVAVGGPRGTSAASLIVEAFGDAVIPQIPEAIGRAILRTEAALAAIYGQAAA